jgi:hypothetical protein
MGRVLEGQACRVLVPRGREVFRGALPRAGRVAFLVQRPPEANLVRFLEGRGDRLPMAREAFPVRLPREASLVRSQAGRGDRLRMAPGAFPAGHRGEVNPVRFRAVLLMVHFPGVPVAFREVPRPGRCPVAEQDFPVAEQDFPVAEQDFPVRGPDQQPRVLVWERVDRVPVVFQVLRPEVACRATRWLPEVPRWEVLPEECPARWGAWEAWGQAELAGCRVLVGLRR